MSPITSCSSSLRPQKSAASAGQPTLRFGCPLAKRYARAMIRLLAIILAFTASSSWARTEMKIPYKITVDELEDIGIVYRQRSNDKSVILEFVMPESDPCKSRYVHSMVPRLGTEYSDQVKATVKDRVHSLEIVSDLLDKASFSIICDAKSYNFKL